MPPIISFVREFGGLFGVHRIAADHHHRDLEHHPGQDSGQQADIDVGQDALGHGGAQVVVEQPGARLKIRLLDHHSDGRDVVAAKCQDLGVLGDEVQVDRGVGAEELLGGARLGAAAAMAPHQLDAHLAHDRLEDLRLVLEIVVESTRGQVGAPHDVAHAAAP